MFSTHPFKEQGLYRELKTIEQEGKYLFHKERRYLNLSSNDYLGIASRTDLQTRFLEQHSHADHFLMSSVSSRLLTGNSPVFEEWEQELARLYGREACLLFNSGYHANSGILPALSGKKDLILADKLVHASIIDGLRLCEGKWLRYKHNDYDDLARLLERHRDEYERVFIVTESVFSMEGDRVDLHRLIKLKKQYDAVLYLDEAHSVGVMGEHGLGLAEQEGVIKEIDLIMGTLGKALASEGAFLICNPDVRDYLVNTCRTLIFTTALPPLQVAWSRFIFREMIQMETQRKYLADLTRTFREKLHDFSLLGDTHIVPLPVPDSAECLRFVELLKDKNIWSMAIRHPTVPANKARVRFSLNAAFTHNDLEEICEAILAQKRQ